MAFRYIDYDSKIRTTLDNKNMWDVIYPVGSIYLTTSIKSPEETFPTPEDFTWKWERMENGYLYATNGDPASGTIGGSNEVTLSTSNIPAHKHTISHRHDRGNMEITGTFTSDSYRDERLSGAFYNAGWRSNNDGWHSHIPQHGVGFQASRSWVGLTSEPTMSESGPTGGGAPFTIQPKYIAVYCWRRIE